MPADTTSERAVEQLAALPGARLACVPTRSTRTVYVPFEQHRTAAAIVAPLTTHGAPERLTTALRTPSGRVVVVLEPGSVMTATCAATAVLASAPAGRGSWARIANAGIAGALSPRALRALSLAEQLLLDAPFGAPLPPVPAAVETLARLLADEAGSRSRAGLPTGTLVRASLDNPELVDTSLALGGPAPSCSAADGPWRSALARVSALTRPTRPLAAAVS